MCALAIKVIGSGPRLKCKEKGPESSEGGGITSGLDWKTIKREHMDLFFSPLLLVIFQCIDLLIL